MTYKDKEAISRAIKAVINSLACTKSIIPKTEKRKREKNEGTTMIKPNTDDKPF